MSGEPFKATDVLWLVFAEVSTGSLITNTRARRDLPVLASSSYDEASTAVAWLRAHPRLGKTAGGRDVTYAIWPHPVPVVRTDDDLRVIMKRAMDFD